MEIEVKARLRDKASVMTKLKAGFARAAKDPEMVAMAEEGIEKIEISDVDIEKWRRKLIQEH